MLFQYQILATATEFNARTTGVCLQLRNIPLPLFFFFLAALHFTLPLYYSTTPPPSFLSLSFFSLFFLSTTLPLPLSSPSLFFFFSPLLSLSLFPLPLFSSSTPPPSFLSLSFFFYFFSPLLSHSLFPLPLFSYLLLSLSLFHRQKGRGLNSVDSTVEPEESARTRSGHT